MNKLWVGSLYYFLNVILHLGVFGVLFFVSVPTEVSTLNYIADFWQSAAGKEVIISNLSLLIVNLIFALGILFLACRSTAILITMAFLAWAWLIFAFTVVDTLGLVAYAAGAIHLTMVSYYHLKERSTR